MVLVLSPRLSNNLPTGSKTSQSNLARFFSDFDDFLAKKLPFLHRTAPIPEAILTFPVICAIIREYRLFGDFFVPLKYLWYISRKEL